MIWYEQAEKKYDSHHLSICMKGYKSFFRVGKYEEALGFISDIIDAHYKYNNAQKNILSYLKEAQIIHINVFNQLNKDVENKILLELGNQYLDLSVYYLELKTVCSSLGLRALADAMFVKENNYRKLNAWQNRNLFAYIGYLAWEVSCNYGTSVYRWFSTSVFFIVFFGFVFSSLPCPGVISTDYPKIADLLYRMNPETNISSIENWYTPFYFSIVTFTTLGFGDVTPNNFPAQIWISLEVIIGYIMLGGLITIFAKKIVR